MTAPGFGLLWFVPPQMREVADNVITQAMDSPTACTHVIGAFLACAHHPEAGVMCPTCARPHVEELLLMAETCVICGADPGDQLGTIPAGENDVLARWCNSCARSRS